MVLSAALVSCSSDEPEVCSSVDDLESSVADAKDVDVTADGAIDELTTALEAVKSDLDAVKADAKSEFADQITSVESAVQHARGECHCGAGNALCEHAEHGRN